MLIGPISILAFYQHRIYSIELLYGQVYLCVLRWARDKLLYELIVDGRVSARYRAASADPSGVVCAGGFDVDELGIHM